MARYFDGTKRLYNANPALTSVPLTMACWFNPDSTTSAMTLLSIYLSGQYFGLQADGDASDRIRAHVWQPPTFALAASTSAYSSGAWQHAAGVFRTTTSRSAYLNGGARGDNTTAATPSLATALTEIGARNASTWMQGSIAEAAIWNVDLSDAEIAWLATGASPLTLVHRLSQLIFYQDLIRPINRPGIGLAMTDTGTTAIRHPRMFGYARPQTVVRHRILGPYSLAAASAFQPGSAKGAIYLPGSVLGQVA